MRGATLPLHTTSDAISLYFFLRYMDFDALKTKHEGEGMRKGSCKVACERLGTCKCCCTCSCSVNSVGIDGIYTI